MTVSILRNRCGEDNWESIPEKYSDYSGSEASVTGKKWNRLSLFNQGGTAGIYPLVPDNETLFSLSSTEDFLF